MTNAKEFRKIKGVVRCNICGLIIRDPKQASKDHEPPLSRGGKPEDWYWTHATCNHAKGSLTIREYNLFNRLLHKACVERLTKEESVAYQALKKMRKVEKYQVEKNFVKKEQRRERRAAARAEKEKNKIPVFTPQEMDLIKQIRAEIRAQRRWRSIDTSRTTFDATELAGIKKMLTEWDSIY